MADRDLTPAEARAEVEAFMGEGWTYAEWWADDGDFCLQVSRGHGISVFGSGHTYRAAVDALKTAWRDAVRPWVVAANEAPTHADQVARVLKEDSK